MATRKRVTEPELNPVEKAELELSTASGSLVLAKREYSNARESLANGATEVTAEQLWSMREQIEYFELRVTGAEKNLETARKAEFAKGLEALAKEIDEYATDADSPIHKAQRAFEDLIASVEAFKEAASAHSSAYSDFNARAKALGAPFDQGPARPLSRVVLRGSQRFGAKSIATERHELASLDSKALLESVFNNQKQADPSRITAGLVRKAPDAGRVYFRSADGSSVAFSPEHVPDPIEQRTRGLTPITGDQVWPDFPEGEKS